MVVKTEKLKHTVVEQGFHTVEVLDPQKDLGDFFR